MIKFYAEKVLSYNFPDGEMLVFTPVTKAGKDYSFMVVVTHASGGVMKSKLARDWIDRQKMPVKLVACDGQYLARKGYDMVNHWPGDAVVAVNPEGDLVEVTVMKKGESYRLRR